MSHDAVTHIIFDMAWCALQGVVWDKEKPMTITREDIMHALAQGYCHDRNAQKEMDVDLLVAMADELMKVLEQHGAISTGEDGPDGPDA